MNVQSDHATYEIPFGSIERPTTRNTPAERGKFEVPAIHWADLSDATHGISILNDSKYGYDAKANVLRLSLLRSPTWPDPNADQGRHDFRYSIFVHDGDWRAAHTVRRGYELNYKAPALQMQNHKGTLPPEHSFLSVEADNVVVTAIKKSEAGAGIIVRFYEWAGKRGVVNLRMHRTPNSAYETDLMERQGSALDLNGPVVSVPTGPYEIKTVLLFF